MAAARVPLRRDAVEVGWAVRVVVRIVIVMGDISFDGGGSRRLRGR